MDSSRPQTVYYEKGIAKHRSEKPSVFERLYPEARASNGPNHRSEVPARRANPSALQSRPPASKPTPPVPAEPSTPVLHSYVNLSDPLPPSIQSQQVFRLAKRPSTQSVKVVVTSELRVPPPNRLELRPVKPGVPDRTLGTSLYQRLVSGKKNTPAPILTLHYSQLSPTVRKYGYTEGCRFSDWEKRASTQGR